MSGCRFYGPLASKAAGDCQSAQSRGNTNKWRRSSSALVSVMLYVAETISICGSRTYPGYHNSVSSELSYENMSAMCLLTCFGRH